MMDAKELQTPATAIEIAQLLNIEGMPPAGIKSIRRLGFELTMLNSHMEKIAGQNKILMESLEWDKDQLNYDVPDCEYILKSILTTFESIGE